jgi:NAD(P)-dependent dehydrogenase (short-subunit alcohol dehydrogenase family)
MNSVEGRVAFITGGASGIGLGMARVFSRAGMKVVIGDIRDDHLEAALAELDAAGLPVRGVKVDVADRASMAAAADEVERLFGKVHLLCNNAGVNLFAPMDECSYADWDWILGVDLGGVVNGVQTFLPRIKRHGEGGHIVNTASMASFITGPSAGIYTTAKFAVRGLSESLRWNLAPQGIGVSCLCPGLVKSTIYESEQLRPASLAGGAATDQAFMARLPEIHQMGMEPDEVAEKTLKGILANDLYIFPHPEFREELREIFDTVLAAVPEGEVDPRRLAVEEGRRARMRGMH